MPRRRGYGSKFRAIKNEIEKAFPGQTNVTGEATPGATGYLEVQVVGGALLHSKKNGMGYVDTADKMQAMCVPCAGLVRRGRPCASRALG